MAAGASLPRSFLIGLFRIWKGDSASPHAARATRHREHLCEIRRPFSAGRVFDEKAAWGLHNSRGGPWGPRGASGPACTARCGREAANASPAKKAPWQQPRGAPCVARGSLSGVGATASRVGHQCFRMLGLTSCFVLWATNACCPLALSGLDLSNPTSLRFDFGRFFPAYSVRRRLPPPATTSRPGAVPLPQLGGCPMRTAGDKCQNAEDTGLRKVKGAKDQGAARTATQRRCGPSSPSPRS